MHTSFIKSASKIYATRPQVRVRPALGRKRSLLIVGAGDIAWRTLPALLTRYRVTVLLRNPEKAPTWRAAGAKIIRGDLDHLPSLNRLSAGSTHLLHLAPPPPEGLNDPRTTHLLAAWMKPNHRSNSVQRAILARPPHPSQAAQATRAKQLVYISTSGVYGDCKGAWIAETHPLAPHNARAKRRVNAEQQLRKWGRTPHHKLSILRVPGIYAAERLPIARLQNKTPAIVDHEDSYTNHIHADDLAHIITRAFRFGRPQRVYHAVDDHPQKMGAYFDLVADAKGLPRVPRISRHDAASCLSPALLSYLNESRRLTNHRIKKELHLTLRYPQTAP